MTITVSKGERLKKNELGNTAVGMGMYRPSLRPTAHMDLLSQNCCF